MGYAWKLMLEIIAGWLKMTLALWAVYQLGRRHGQLDRHLRDVRRRQRQTVRQLLGGLRADGVRAGPLGRERSPGSARRATLLQVHEVANPTMETELSQADIAEKVREQWDQLPDEISGHGRYRINRRVDRAVMAVARDLDVNWRTVLKAYRAKYPLAGQDR